MKNTKLYELRSLIRQFLVEMPYAGALPAASPRHHLDDEDEPTTRANANKRRKLDNFHNSKKFAKEATWVFEEFPQQIYILPIPSAHGSSARTFSLEGQAALDYIDDFGLDEESSYVDLYDIEKKLSSGATIIISHIEEMSPGFLPTAWMIIHAICDSDPLSIKELKPLVQEIRGYVTRKFGVDELRQCLTMNSAKNLSNEGDGAAEIMTQEMATRIGFHWKIPEGWSQSKKTEVEKNLLELKSMMSGFKERFMASAAAKSGMAIVVNTYPSVN